MTWPLTGPGLPHVRPIQLTQLTKHPDFIPLDVSPLDFLKGFTNNVDCAACKTTPIQGNTKVSPTGLFYQILSRCKTQMITYKNGISQ